MIIKNLVITKLNQILLLEQDTLDKAFEVPLKNNESKDKVNMNNNMKDYNSKDYLPKTTNKNWFETDFASAKYQN